MLCNEKYKIMHALYERDCQKVSVRDTVHGIGLSLLCCYIQYLSNGRHMDIETSGQAFGIVSSQLLLF